MLMKVMTPRLQLVILGCGSRIPYVRKWNMNIVRRCISFFNKTSDMNSVVVELSLECWHQERVWEKRIGRHHIVAQFGPAVLVFCLCFVDLTSDPFHTFFVILFLSLLQVLLQAVDLLSQVAIPFSKRIKMLQRSLLFSVLCVRGIVDCTTCGLVHGFSRSVHPKLHFSWILERQ